MNTRPQNTNDLTIDPAIDHAPAAANAARVQHRPATRRGMTMVEILFAVLIVFLVMGLLIGAIRMASRTARDTGHRTAATSLKQGVEQFRQEFGFHVPLVRDIVSNVGTGATPTIAFGGDPVAGTPKVVQIYSVGANRDFLRYLPPATQADYRFSIYSLSYYLVGTLDSERGGIGSDAQSPIDGLSGPGFRTPRRDGSFEHTGRTFQPFFSVGSGSTTIFRPADREWGFELRDSTGVAFRYYRWEPNQGNPPSASADPENYRRHLAVPRMVGDAIDNPDLRMARYAIVGAGPDGLFGDEHMLHQSHPQHIPLGDMRIRLGLPSNSTVEQVMTAARADNIVEVGQ